MQPTLIRRMLLLASAAVLVLSVGLRAEQANAPASADLEQGFRNPPDETKPWTYWYWLNGNITREGITKDLECMAKVGIGQALIGIIHIDGEPQGDVQILSEKFWEMIEHAIREGKRTGVKIGMFNCPGWSQSGGPWIKPDQTMRYLVSTEKRVTGPKKVEVRLPAPREIFQDVATLAFPAPRSDMDAISAHSPEIACTPPAQNPERMVDGDLRTVCFYPTPVKGKSEYRVDIKTDEPFTARSLVVHLRASAIRANAQLQAADASGELITVKTFELNRTKDSVNVGPMPYGPVAVAFPAVKSKHYRLVFTKVGGKGAIAELELSSAARLESYVEKQLGKLHQTPQPMWDAYLWPKSTEPEGRGLTVQPGKVIDLSDKIAADGSLTWDAPEGEWIILRTGMSPTGQENGPAAPEARGYEVDKMNRQAVASHFDAYIGKLLKRMPEEDRSAFERVVADSYETGSENWTEGFGKEFQERYGYDPKPWLPALTGRVVGSAEESDRFLWDVRRLVADRIARDYVGGLREECHKHGLKLWLENYGHWGFPAEFLQYGGQTDGIGGEFWATGNLGSIELRAAASAAHTYGKRVISAEAFTGGPAFVSNPFSLKARGDWAYTEGINHFVLHVNIHQPWDDRKPGMNAWFGTEFNRNNTWFPVAKPWIDYMRRCHYLLQRGAAVADVCYFIGEDVPKMTGVRDPALPKGYDFDYINGEVIREKLQVKDGRFVLPSGTSYRLMVLPKLETMRPEVLERIRDLVKAGGAIVGPQPARSPSLAGYPECDQRVKAIAGEIWNNVAQAGAKGVPYGKGRVFTGVELQPVLDALDTPPDVTDLGAAPILWTHRAADDVDIYFLSNQQNKVIDATPSFRVSGKQPELWNANTGEKRALPAFSLVEGGRTSVPLRFDGYGSWFVVFRKDVQDAPAEANVVANFPGLDEVKKVDGSWQVHFPAGSGAPEETTFEQLKPWAESDNAAIKYFSGTATYNKSFELTEEQAAHKPLILDLGNAQDIAEVIVNGKTVGYTWKHPWRVDATGALRAGENQLEIRVTNTWKNRLVGEQLHPEVFPDAAERGWEVWTSVKTLKATPQTPLDIAGLLGPVSVKTPAEQ